MPEFQWPFGRVDLVVRAVACQVVGDRVEDEELALRADVARIGDPGLSRYSSARFAIRRGSFAYGSRVIGSTTSQMIESVGASVNGSSDRGVGLRHQQHVALGDPLPAADRRAVEAEALVERLFAERTKRQRHVLPRARAGR